MTVLSVTRVINGNKIVFVEVCKALKKSPCSVLRECVSSCTRCSADYDLEQQPEEKTGQDEGEESQPSEPVSHADITNFAMRNRIGPCPEQNVQ